MGLGDSRRTPYSLEELEELAKNSTDVVNWYPYMEVSGATVRGPWSRWFRVNDIDYGKEHVAAALDDAKYAAAAMNSLPQLIKEIKDLKKALTYAVNSIETANEIFDPDEDDVEEMNQWIKEMRETFKLETALCPENLTASDSLEISQ